MLDYFLIAGMLMCSVLGSLSKTDTCAKFSRQAFQQTCSPWSYYNEKEWSKTETFKTVKKMSQQVTSLAVIPYNEANIPLHERPHRNFSIAGHCFTIPQNYTGLGVAACVWDAAIVLAEYLESHRDLVQNKKVLELGAGTGLTGLVAAALGADVTVTERAEVLNHLTSTLKLNTQNRPWTISAQVLDWTQMFDVADFPGYDLILGADIIYVEETFPDLLRTLKTLAWNDQVSILLSCKIRYDRDLQFLEMLKLDFEISDIFFDNGKQIRVFSVRRRM